MISQHSAAIRMFGAASAVAVALALSACGEYSPIDDTTTQTDDPTETAQPTPDPTDEETPTPDPTETDEEEETISYAWGLPPTDTSVTGNDGPAYGSLAQSCDSAQNFLDSTVDQRFYGFSNPRYVVLYMAGLEQCRGNAARAAELTSGAIAFYGTQGIDSFGEPDDPATSEPYPTPLPPGYGEPECDLYRSLVSVRDQVSPEGISCPSGNPPPFTSQNHLLTTPDFVDYVEVWDDPCTFGENESQNAPTEPAYPPTSFCGPEHPGVPTPIGGGGG